MPRSFQPGSASSTNCSKTFSGHTGQKTSQQITKGSVFFNSMNHMKHLTGSLEPIESYLAELEMIDWFSHVGSDYQKPGIRLVSDWEEACRWTSQPISEWCDLEAKQRIYRFMSAAHYDQFAKWNEVAKSILPLIEPLVDMVRPRFPANSPDNAIDWFQCQIVGASMELYYATCIDSKLFRDQLEIYKQGHFPCGWYVESEDRFPEHAILIVY